jgi:2-oxoglutarate/2-oxoacid ferredoxin oxidoreductase subunit beta
VKIYALHKYFRKGALPHFYCSGCGAGQVLNYFVRASDELNLDFDKMVAVGGVGCTARIPVFLNVEALHGIHGRTLPWATGIKLHNPNLKVVIFAGDGDTASIGGNHLIHACRRNIDVTVIVVNNLTFGMTGGQVAPTTPKASSSATTPYGNPEPPFDICKVAIAAGATFVARWNTSRSTQAIRAIKKALKHRGFSLVEMVCQCPTQFGRSATGSGDPVKLLKWIDERSVTVEEANNLPEREVVKKFVLGNFVEKEEPVFEGSSVYYGTEEG